MIKIMIIKIKNFFKLFIFKIIWRKRNKHNYTNVKDIFPIEKVTVGKKTYGAINVKTYDNQDEKLIIGSYCSIGGNVKFLLGGEHPYTGLSTYPFKKFICGIKEKTITKGPILVEDDVWIGEGCLILSGVTIGRGAVIAAGSIVAKDIPPYAIYAGGKVIKYRFSEDIIKRLLEFDYEKLNEKIIKENIDFLYSDLNSDLLDNKFFKDNCADRSKADEQKSDYIY